MSGKSVSPFAVFSFTDDSQVALSKFHATCARVTGRVLAFLSVTRVENEVVILKRADVWKGSGSTEDIWPHSSDPPASTFASNFLT